MFQIIFLMFNLKKMIFLFWSIKYKKDQAKNFIDEGKV